MGKLRRLRVLERFQSEVDSHHRTQMAEHGQPSCKPGCDACCTQVVWMELIEAVQIIDRYPDVVARARPTLETQAELVNGYPEDPKLVAAAWWRARQRCAFLADDGRCSIYPVRPMTCRVHFVLSDPYYCGRDHRGPDPDASQAVTLLDVGGTRNAGPQHVAKIGAASRAPAPDKPSEVWWGPLPQVMIMALTKGNQHG